MGSLTISVIAFFVAMTNALQSRVNGAASASIDNPVIADDGPFTPTSTSVMMAGFQADEASTDSVDEGDGGAARMTLDRKIIVTHCPCPLST
jgi:hypothetical protein